MYREESRKWTGTLAKAVCFLCVVSILLCYKLTFSGPASSASSPRTAPGWSAWRSRAVGRLWGPSTELLYPRLVKHVNGLVATYIPGNRLLSSSSFVYIYKSPWREGQEGKSNYRKKIPYAVRWSLVELGRCLRRRDEDGGRRREEEEKVSSSPRG